MDIRVLGPIEVVGVAGPAAIGGPRQRRLLAMLAANTNRVIGTDELIDGLWEGEPPDGANRSFKTYVARLRAALEAAEPDGSRLIVTHPSGYALEMEPEKVDTTRFELLVQRARAELALGEVDTAAAVIEEALALWRGEPFGDFAADGWAQAHGARLTEAHAVAQELAVEIRLAAGDAAEVLPGLDELVARFPYRDRLRGLRMTALYRSGRQVEALRELRDYRSLLAEEIGVEPGPELTELEQQILNQAQDLQPDRAPDRRLRDYRLGDRVGADEFAVVYRGTQVSVERDVAVKIIRPELADRPRFIQRFTAEAQAMASVEHPNLVPIYDYWREPGGAYLVMRWLGGGSLASRIERGGVLSASAVVQLVSQLGGAMMISSQGDAAPRAITPSNVVFDDHGAAYVTAFGMDGTTEPDEASLPYRPPEYLERAELSPRSDVYTLGAVACFALTGRLPGGVPPDLPSLEKDVADVLRRACSPDPADRPSDVADLIVAVRAAAGEGTPGTTAADERAGVIAGELERVNPYKGLRPFAEGDSRDFFGRTEVIDDLVAHVHAAPLTCVVGPSGSGKSSVVRAGLIPGLRRQGWFVATMIPGARPYEALDRALVAVTAVADPTVLAQLTAGPEGISRAAHGVLPPDGRLLLAVDQFEELFTVTDTDRRDGFLAGLAHLMEDPDSRVRVVFTLRADFFDRPLLHPAIGPIVRDNSVAITPLTAHQLEAAITGPARLRGVAFEPALVADLVADATANPGNLPLLQYALTELYGQRARGRITQEAYEEMGRMSGTLARRADALLEELGPANEDAVRHLFTRLVTAGEGAEDTRRRAVLSELAAVPERVIEVYAQARLLTFDRDGTTREPTVEVAHEALIREWPRLRRWIDEDREGLRVFAHLAETARTWDERGRDAADLYRGSRLAAATEFREHRSTEIGDLAGQFLDASTAAVDDESRRLRRSRRRFRALSVALAGVLVVAMLAAWLAADRSNEASDRAQEAEVLALSAAAENVRDVRPDLAALLAVEATERSGATDIGPVIGALANVPRSLQRLSPESGGVWAMVVSGDGSRVAVDDGERLEVLDAQTFELVADLGEGGTDDFHVSADGSIVGVTYEDAGNMDLVDVDSGQVVRTIPGPVLYSRGRPEGEGFGVVTEDGNGPPLIEFYSSPTAEPVEIGRGGLGPFSGDGRFVVLGGPAGDLLVDLAAPAQEPIEIALPPTALGMVPDETGARLWVPLASGRVQLIDVASGTAILDSEFAPGVRAPAIHGDTVAVIHESSVQLHDLTTGAPLGAPYEAPPGLRGVYAGFDTSGNLLTAGGRLDRWNVTGSGTSARSLVPGDYGARFSPQSDRLVTTTRSAELHVHELASRSQLVDGADIDRNGTPITRTPMRFTPDGARVVTVGAVGPATGPSGVNFFGEGRVRLVDVATGETVDEVRSSVAEATAVAVSPDGSSVAIGYRFGRVEIRSLNDLSERRSELFIERAGAGDSTVLGLDFSADSALLRVTPEFGPIEAYDLDGSPADASAFPTDAEIEVLPDGRVVGGSPSGVVTVYDAEGEPLRPALVGHSGRIDAIAVGGGLVATASSDGTVRVWDLEELLPVGDAIPVAAPIVDLSPDGRWLATVGTDGTRLWDLDPGALIEEACALAARNMTLDEWGQYLPFAGDYEPTCPQWPDPTDE